MDAIETLTAEHRVMEEALDALEDLATALDAGAKMVPAELQGLVSALAQYLQRHDAMEEGVLFAHLVARGFPPTAGPVAAISSGHARCRGQLASLARVVALAVPWTGEARGWVASLARSCVRDLRELISTEDTRLFPAAREHLPDDVMKCVQDELMARADRGQAERLELLVDALSGRGPTSRATSQPQYDRAIGGQP